VVSRFNCTYNYIHESPWRLLSSLVTRPEEPAVPVDPTGADLKHFLAEDTGGPVVMLNLLRFKKGARGSYDEYARKIRPFLDEYDAQVLYGGDCSTVLVAPKSHEWDALLVVRYPSRQTFSAMVANPRYQEITGLRTEALEEAVLQATVPWPSDE
jgi:uncharacterized protein (DUF1330 family)